MDIFFCFSFLCPTSQCLIVSALSRKGTSLVVIKLAHRQECVTCIRPGRFQEIAYEQEGFKNFITSNFAFFS
jgi:hypothetical protein